MSDAAQESALVAGLGRVELDVSVVRRCADVTDLLSAAAAGTAQAALLSPELRGLDSDVMYRLLAAGVRPIGVVGRSDEPGERRLRQLGVTDIVSVEDDPSVVAEAIRRAVAGAGTTRDFPLLSVGADPLADGATGDAPGTRGEVIVVWGPTGAPGRTTVALGLADAFARAGQHTLLVDADVYGGVVAQAIGLLDEAPGLAAAARLHSAGGLDVAELAAQCRALGDRLRVLTGIARPDRWPEIRADAVTDVLERARMLTAVTVVDCGFCLEQDEELAYDTLAPRRNGATLAALEAADTVVVVGTADPIGLARLIRGLAELDEAVPATPRRVVVNRTRRGVTPGDPQREIADVLSRHAGVEDVAFLPEDRDACDRALGAGRMLADVAPSVGLSKALRRLASSLIAAVSEPVESEPVEPDVPSVRRHRRRKSA